MSCAPGTYGDEKDASACKPCPAGTYSLVGAVSMDQCSLCPALTVASSAGTSECLNCGDNDSPDGSFRSSPDRTDCECTDGHYMDLNFGLGVDKTCRTCPKRGATCTKDRIVGKVRRIEIGRCSHLTEGGRRDTSHAQRWGRARRRATGGWTRTGRSCISVVCLSAWARLTRCRRCIRACRTCRTSSTAR